MTPQITLKEMAEQLLIQWNETGLPVDSLIGKWKSFVDRDTEGAVRWINIGGGSLFPDPQTDEQIKIKPYQIGIAIHRKGGVSEYGVYNIPELWDDIVNPKPVQLELF